MRRGERRGGGGGLWKLSDRDSELRRLVEVSEVLRGWRFTVAHGGGGGDDLWLTVMKKKRDADS